MMAKRVTLPLQLVLLTAGLIGLHNAKAASCSAVGSKTLTVPPIIVQRDVPVNSRLTLLGEAIVPNSKVYTCTGSVQNGFLFAVKTYGTASELLPGSNLYKTNIPGVEYSVSTSLGAKTDYSLVRNSLYILVSSGIFWDMAAYDFSASFRVAFYKTGPTGTGVVSSKQIGAGIMQLEGVWIEEYPVYISSFNFTTLACSISSANISVPMGDVLVTKFTGVGAMPVTKTFNVGLNCDANARVNVSLSGTANTDIANADILALSNAGTAGVADGLGVQMLYNGAPLKRDTRLLLKTTAGGVETFPFAARYYQTKSVVKPGKANATATLNLTYQ